MPKEGFSIVKPASDAEVRSLGVKPAMKPADKGIPWSWTVYRKSTGSERRVKIWKEGFGVVKPAVESHPARVSGKIRRGT